jgi:hypothetical protein
MARTGRKQLAVHIKEESFRRFEEIKAETGLSNAKIIEMFIENYSVNTSTNTTITKEQAEKAVQAVLACINTSVNTEESTNTSINTKDEEIAEEEFNPFTYKEPIIYDTIDLDDEDEDLSYLDTCTFEDLPDDWDKYLPKKVDKTEEELKRIDALHNQEIDEDDPIVKMIRAAGMEP